MSGLLPDSIDPLEWAKTGQRVGGALPLAGMDRLNALVEAGVGEVEITLAGQLLAGGRPVLSGHVACTVTVRCQRCLAPFELRLEAPIRLGVLADEADLARLPKGHEPLICPAGATVSLAELIEDELLLALPDYPHHAEGMCSASTVPAQETGKRQPFAALASLRKNGPQSGQDD